MDLSLFLAQLLGLYLVIVCLAALYHRDIVAVLVKEIGSNTSVLLFSGTIHIILGLLVILSHNIWSTDWRVLITVLGWITLAKGIIRLFFPHKVLIWGSRVASGPTHTALVVVFLCVGVYLALIGFKVI